MARTQKNKATAHHLGLLKARLAKLRRELITPKGGGGGAAGEGDITFSRNSHAQSAAWRTSTHKDFESSIKLFAVLYFSGFDVAKTGDARIGFVGFPSVGKSTLLSNLAGVYSEVAAYEFTTLTTVPGVIRYKGAKIQVHEISFSFFSRASFYFHGYTAVLFGIIFPSFAFLPSFLISRELLREPRMEKAEADKLSQVEFAITSCVFERWTPNVSPSLRIVSSHFATSACS